MGADSNRRPSPYQGNAGGIRAQDGPSHLSEAHWMTVTIMQIPVVVSNALG